MSLVNVDQFVCILLSLLVLRVKCGWDLIVFISDHCLGIYFSGTMQIGIFKGRKENPQKLTQLSSRSHPRHLVGKKTAQKDTIIDITSDSQVNSNFPYRWSPASLTFNNYFYLFLYLYIT